MSMKFILLINVKMPTIVGILTFISIINTSSYLAKLYCQTWVFYFFVGIHEVFLQKNKMETTKEDEKLELLFRMLKLTVLPAKSDSDVMFCLQSYQGLRIERSLVY